MKKVDACGDYSLAGQRNCFLSPLLIGPSASQGPMLTRFFLLDCLIVWLSYFINSIRSTNDSVMQRNSLKGRHTTTMTWVRACCVAHSFFDLICLLCVYHRFHALWYVLDIAQWISNELISEGPGCAYNIDSQDLTTPDQNAVNFLLLGWSLFFLDPHPMFSECPQAHCFSFPSLFLFGLLKFIFY